MARKPKQSDTLERVCQNVSDVVVAVDQQEQVCLFNPAAEHAFDLAADQIIGHRLEEHTVTQSLAALFAQASPHEQLVIDQFALPPGRKYRVQFLPASAAGRIAILSKPGRSADTADNIASLMHEVIHTLKTPITSAKSFIELTEAAGTLNEKQATFARRAQGSLEYMLTLVHELLDVAWMESGGELLLSEVNLNDLVRNAVVQLDGYSQRKGVPLEVHLAPQNCLVEADARRLGDAIINLVSNAIKYSPQGGTVQISVAVEDSVATIRVQDHGLGIAPEHQSSIFQMFYRIHRPETQRIEGSGLGLAIVKAVVEKHGSTVRVDSALGEGSVFEFSLPLLAHPNGKTA
jgi:signal transduction histidine kinase